MAEVVGADKRLIDSLVSPILFPTLTLISSCRQFDTQGDLSSLNIPILHEEECSDANLKKNTWKT